MKIVKLTLSMAKDNSQDAQDVYTGIGVITSDEKYIKIPDIGMRISLDHFDIGDDEKEYRSYSCNYENGGFVGIFIDF